MWAATLPVTKSDETLISAQSCFRDSYFLPQLHPHELWWLLTGCTESVAGSVSLLWTNISCNPAIISSPLVWTGRRLEIGFKIDQRGVCVYLHSWRSHKLFTCDELLSLEAACTSLLFMCFPVQRRLFKIIIGTQQGNYRTKTLSSNTIPKSDILFLTDGKLKTCFAPCAAAAVITSVSPSLTRHYCRRVAINRGWRKALRVLQASDHSRGLGSVDPWHRGRHSGT